MTHDEFMESYFTRYGGEDIAAWEAGGEAAGEAAWIKYEQTGVLPWATTTPTVPPPAWPAVPPDELQPYVPPTPGALPTGGTPLTATINQQIAEQFDPFTSYLSSLGLGQRPALTPAEQYRVGLYDPISTLQGAQQRMAMSFPQQYDPGTGYISDYAQPYLQNPFSMYAQARGMLGTAFGATPEQRAGMGMQYAPMYEGGELASRGGVSELGSLLEMALRPGLGKTGGSWLSGRLPFEQQMWAGQQAAGGTGGFLDYIKQKYNLGQWI